jgi:fatty-acid desaturase
MALFFYCVLLYCIGGLDASVMYHRILTHRVATLHPILRKILIVLALPSGTPVQWVGSHRQHHQFVDKIGDPHSPVLDGFWFAHCGWYIQSKKVIYCIIYALLGVFRFYFDGYWRPRTNQEYNSKAIDIQQDAFCAYLSQKAVYQWFMWIYASILVLVGFHFFGKIGVFTTWLTLLIVYNLGDAINSFAHLKGTLGAVYHRARNNTFLGYFAFGEGWHANHHDRADQANLGEFDEKIDLGYLFMQFFEKLGLLKFQTNHP